jgi:cation transport protein ChaC
MSLTPELVSLCFRKEERRGYGDQWTPLTEAEQDSIALGLLDELGAEPLWVFAYGSLIWKPTFEAIEKRRATAIGWHRSFCMELIGWRATPEQPGLMMALDRGGRCTGVAFRLRDEDRLTELSRIVRREIVVKEDLDMVRWIKVHTEAGKLRALVFWAGPKQGEGISLKLPLEKVAWVLARACGHAGSCAEYLYNTVSHLEALGIRDRNLWRLQHLVAEEIVRIHKTPAMSREAAISS